MDDKPLGFSIEEKHWLNLFQACSFFLALVGTQSWLLKKGIILISPFGFSLGFLAFIFPVWEYFFLLSHISSDKVRYWSGWGVLLLMGIIFETGMAYLFIFFCLVLFLSRSFVPDRIRALFILCTLLGFILPWFFWAQWVFALIYHRYPGWAAKIGLAKA